MNLSKLSLILVVISTVCLMEMRSESFLPSPSMAAQKSGIYIYMQAHAFNDSNDRGSDYSNMDNTPESLIYRHLLARKKGSISELSLLYGDEEIKEVRQKYSDVEEYPTALKPYTDIEFVGKVKIGDTVRFRVNMVGSDVRPFPMVQYAVNDAGRYRLTLRGENESFISRVGRGHFVNDSSAADAQDNIRDDFDKAIETGSYRAIVFSAEAEAGSAAFYIETDSSKIKAPPPSVAASVVLRYESSERLTEADRSNYNTVLSKLIYDSQNYSSDSLAFWYSDNDQKILKRFGDSIPASMEAVKSSFSGSVSHAIAGVIRDSEYVVFVVEIQLRDGGMEKTLIPFRRKADKLILFFRDGNGTLLS